MIECGVLRTYFPRLSYISKKKRIMCTWHLTVFWYLGIFQMHDLPCKSVIMKSKSQLSFFQGWDAHGSDTRNDREAGM